MENPTDKADQQILVTKLITGKATQEERDQALATVLLSLWGQKELKELIRMVHNEECQKCPFKKQACAMSEDEDEGVAWKKVALVLLKYGGWGIVIVATLLKVKLPM